MSAHPGASRSPIFPSKWGALKHAVRSARAKRRCRVAVLERGGAVALSHDYAEAP
jgi:hypothetical protein